MNWHLGRGISVALGGLSAAVLSGCGGESPTMPIDPGTTVMAVVFYDENQNGALDSSEVVRVPGVEVTIDFQSGRSQPITGLAAIPAVPAGSHSLSVVTSTLPPFYAAGAPIPLVAPQPANTTLHVPLTLPIGTNLPNRYMASGDSISDGVGSADETGYRTLLEDRLRAYLGAAEVLYRGPGAGQSWEGAARIDGDLADARPAYTLIMWGTNDWWDCDSVETCFSIPSLRQIVRNVRARSSLPCLATIPPVNVGFDWRVPPERDVWVAAINDQIRALARQEQALLVDVHAALVAQPNRAALFSDHVHPNDAGYEVIAKAFYDALTQPRGSSASPTGLPFTPWPAEHAIPGPGEN